MNSFIVICVLSVIALSWARAEEKYTDKYDNVNIKEVLENDKLLQAHLKCLLDQDKCSPDGRELKSHIKEALENGCAKCNDTQKDRVREVIQFLIHEKPEYWTELSAKYDPEDKYAKKYEKELKEVKDA